MAQIFGRIFVLLLCGVSVSASAQVRVFIDQAGYETNAPKQALIPAQGAEHPSHFMLMNWKTGTTVLRGELKPAGEVDQWNTGHYWLVDFSSWKQPGTFVLEMETNRSVVKCSLFLIEKNLLERTTLSDVIYCFKGQRESGDMNRAGRHPAVPDEHGKFVDVHGGQYDATGDYGIHLSHQNPTSYFNRQQVLLVAWSLLQSFRTLGARHNDNFSEYERRLLD